MALRVSFNNQMYKVPKLPTDLKAVTDVVSFLFGAELQQGWVLEYLDPKEGPIALTDEEAFKKLQKNMWASKKPVKLNMRFTGDLEQNTTRTNEERSVLSSMNTTIDTVEARRETQTTTNDALTTDTQSQQHTSDEEQEEVIESEEQTMRESEIESLNNSRNKRKDKHRDLKQLRATLQKTLDITKAQETQSQSESAPILAVALQLRKPKRNPGSSSGKSQSPTGQNSRQIIRDMHLQQKHIIDLLVEDEENDDEDDSYEGNSTTANEKSKSLKQMYDSEIQEKVIRMYDIFPDKDLKDLRRFVSPIHYLPIETLIEKFLAC